MRHIVLDANVLISFLTDRNEQQQKQAATLFREAVLGEHILVLPQVSLMDMVHVLLKLYHRSRSETAEMLSRSSGTLSTAPEALREILLPKALKMPGSHPTVPGAPLG